MSDDATPTSAGRSDESRAATDDPAVRIMRCRIAERENDTAGDTDTDESAGTSRESESAESGAETADELRRLTDELTEVVEAVAEIMDTDEYRRAALDANAGTDTAGTPRESESESELERAVRQGVERAVAEGVKHAVERAVESEYGVEEPEPAEPEPPVGAWRYIR